MSLPGMPPGMLLTMTPGAPFGTPPGQGPRTAARRGILSLSTGSVWLAFDPPLAYSSLGFLKGSGEPGA